MKTPEQLAIEWLKEEYGDTSNWTYGGQEMSLDAFYAGYQAARQWISVKERLPEMDQEVLGYEKPFISTCLFWRSRSMEHQWELSNGRNCNPTHWMPIPNPPEE